MTSAAQRPKSPPASTIATATAIPALEPVLDIDLPTEIYSDEPQLETDFHIRQILLLLTCLELVWEGRNDFYATVNASVYYSPKKIKSRDFRGPDFFVVLNTERRLRKSWVLWEEDYKYPDFIVEVLSESTAQVDRTTKKALYQDIWRVPEYFWFDPVSLEFEGFVLMNGTYQPIEATDSGWRWSEQLGLYLGLHQRRLRYFERDGALVPTPEERAKQVQLQADSAKAEADSAKAEAKALRNKLRSLGIDPDA